MNKIVMDTSSVKNEIGRAIQQGLPGYEAHSELAPAYRERLMQGQDAETYHKAAVLIMLYQADGQWHFPLIMRAPSPYAHGSQVGLPGGRLDLEDNQNLKQTALRETQEEIGIPPHHIELMGGLTPLPIPVSKHLVLPYVGICTQENIQFKIDPVEVDFVIPCPLKTLINQEPFINETERPYYLVGEHKVWGATAMILREFQLLLHQNNLSFH